MQTKSMQCRIRKAAIRDHESMLEIEAYAHDGLWTEDRMCETLASAEISCRVATIEGKIVGYLFYRIIGRELHLLNLNVAMRSRGRRVGTQLIDFAKSLREEEKCNSIHVLVPDSRVRAHFFFRRQSFRAIRVVRNGTSIQDGSLQDGYLFVFKPKGSQR